MSENGYVPSEVSGKVISKRPDWRQLRLEGKEGNYVFKNFTPDKEQAKFDTIDIGDHVRLLVHGKEGMKTQHVIEVLEHKQAVPAPGEQASLNNVVVEYAGASVVEPFNASKVLGTTNIPEVTHTLGVEPFVHPVVSIDKIVGAFDDFEKLKSNILKPKDYLYIDGNGKWHKTKPEGEYEEYIRKTGWQKLALALSLDVAMISKEKIMGQDSRGRYYVWNYLYRVSHPSGKYVITEGSCSSRDAFFSKARGMNVDPNESDIINTSQTVAINRAIAILVGGGVSAEEMMMSKGG